MNDVERPDDGHVGDLLSAHVDGELDADASAWVRSHLQECRPCREQAADVETARAWVRSLPDVDATPVVERLLARHRAAVRAGVAFVGLAAVVAGSLALTAAVLRPDVVPDVDSLVATHLAATAGSGLADAQDVDMAADLDGMGGAESVRRVGLPYRAPMAMAMGGDESSFNRRALYDGDDLTVVVYDDGASIVSVFQQPGRLDRDGLPAGTTVTEGRREAWMPLGGSWSDDGGRDPTVVVSQIGDLVVTVVSDDPGAAMAVIDQLPDGRRDSSWHRLHDACTRLTEVFSLGG